MRLDLKNSKPLFKLFKWKVVYPGGVNCCFFCVQHARQVKRFLALKAIEFVQTIPTYFMSHDEYARIDDTYIDTLLTHLRKGTPFGIDVMRLNR